MFLRKALAEEQLKLVKEAISKLRLTDYEFFQTAWVWQFPWRQYDVASDTCQYRINLIVQPYMYDYAHFIMQA